MVQNEIKVDEDVLSFLTESRELLEDVEPQLIRLGDRLDENIPADEETVNLIFRAFHTIKGTAAFYQFDHVVSITHKAETLLEFFRRGAAEINVSCTDLLCQAGDVAEKLFKQIERTGNDRGIEDDVRSLLLRLNGRIHNILEMADEIEGQGLVIQQQEAFYQSSDSLEEGGLKRVGENSKIFITEGRNVLADVESGFVHIPRGDDTENLVDHQVIEKGIESINILAETASFLDYENVTKMLQVTSELLAGVMANGCVMRRTQMDVFINNCEVIKLMFEYIEKKGVDNGLEKDGSAFDLSKVGQVEIPGDIHETSYGFKKRIRERRDVRVNIEKLDELINLIGELVIAENMVVSNPDVINMELENFERASLHLSKVVRDLQDVALAVRMIPILGVFRKMIRLVHDLSAKSGKKIALKFYGEDTEIDKTVAELIADPLVHLVRNAIDHGIEKNKNPANEKNDGEVILESRHEGGEVWVIVKDNGKGLDREKLLFKGIELGIVEGDGSGLSDQDVYELIFHPGFSTSESVTAVSGRGVGMDVVKKNLEKIKGQISVYSRKGVGTTFVLRIPLTLAIIEGMLVRVGAASYTIPMLSIRESLKVNSDSVTITMDGQEMVHVREELIPIIRIHELYNIESEYKEIHEGILVVVEHQSETAGLFIDSIIGEQQTVIKGLSGYMKNLKGISGCTILGDGDVSLILDAGGLIQRTCLTGE